MKKKINHKNVKFFSMKSLHFSVLNITQKASRIYLQHLTSFQIWRLYGARNPKWHFRNQMLNSFQLIFLQNLLSPLASQCEHCILLFCESCAKESVNEILAKSYYTTFYSFKGKRQVLDPDPKLPRSPPRPIKARGIWTPVNLHFTFALKMPYELFQIWKEAVTKPTIGPTRRMQP